MTIDENEPQPGFYKTQLIRNGPWVPARIWWDEGEKDPDTGELLSDQMMRCEVDGKERNAYNEWLFLSKHPITEDQYRLMSAQADWDRAYDPESPGAQPKKAVDWGALKPKF